MIRLLPFALLALSAIALPGCGTTDSGTLRCAEGSADGSAAAGEAEAVMQVMPLQHARAEALAPVISDLIRSDADLPKVIVDERLNALIVYGEREHIEAIALVVAELDAAPE